jgi:PAS domain S-box-containing protein
LDYEERYMQPIENNRILVIDDNPAIHDDFRKILCASDEGAQLADAEAILFGMKAPAADRARFEVHTAHQGQEGLVMVQRALEANLPYAVAFVDIRMPPGWDGIETLTRIWECDPNLQAVICSAYSDYSWEDITSRLGHSDRLLILKKPFDNIEVIQLAHALTNKWLLTQKLLQKFEENQRLLATFFNNSSEAIMISDGNKRGIAVNPAFTRLTGYTLDDLVKNETVVDENLLANTMNKSAWDAMRQQEQWQGELSLKHKSNSAFPAWLHRNAVKSESGDVVNYLTLFSDITQLKDQQKQLEQLAKYDNLTGLPNRAMFYDRLKQATEAAQRRNSRYALAFIDADNFKYVNDTLGHAAGDQLLRLVAERLKSILRREDVLASTAHSLGGDASLYYPDTLCRFGGDEFALLLEDIANVESVEHIMQRIADAFKQGFKIDGHQLFTTASIGVAIFPDDGADVETLLRNSDTAMYKAKESGKNGHQFFTVSMNQEASDRLLLETRLRNALDAGQFHLAYQPQVDIRTNEVIGVEALIRCHDPELSAFSPLHWIQVAEQSGLINSIGQWVILEACRQVREWREKGIHTRVSVNISARQFQQKNIANMISEALAQYHLAPGLLELELTESAVMHDPEYATKVLTELKTAGVSIAIDDFGTGYSSLAYLKRFPVDKLKIDRTFVRDVVEDSDDAAIVTAVISLAHSLGIRVIAEGVETAEQLEFLRIKRCDEAQGYYFSRPVTAAMLEDYLAQHDTTPAVNLHAVRSIGR